MLPKPEFEDWQSFLRLVKKSVELKQDDMLLAMIMTTDEKDIFVSRVNILCELLKGDLSQRQISQMLGVGVATITRGSNELKGISEDEKIALSSLLLNIDKHQ